MALKTMTVGGITYSNEDWDAVTKPYGIKKTGWRQSDNLFNMLLGLLGEASPGLQDTSVTANTIGTGAKAFTLVNNRPMPAGAYAFAIDSADITKWMFGQIASHVGSDISITVELTNGAGVGIATWLIQPCGPRGAAGAVFFTAIGIQATGYVLAVNEWPIADCRATAACSYTLPPNVTVQQKIKVTIVGDGQLTLARNATAPQVQLCEGAAEDAVLTAPDGKSCTVEAMWVDNTTGWVFSVAQ